jgi:hypothetical protein
LMSSTLSLYAIFFTGSAPALEGLRNCASFLTLVR